MLGSVNLSFKCAFYASLIFFSLCVPAYVLCTIVQLNEYLMSINVHQFVSNAYSMCIDCMGTDCLMCLKYIFKIYLQIASILFHYLLKKA